MFTGRSVPAALVWIVQFVVLHLENMVTVLACELGTLGRIGAALAARRADTLN